MLVPALEEDLHVCVRVRLQFCGSRETQGQGRRILEPPVKVPPRCTLQKIPAAVQPPFAVDSCCSSAVLSGVEL